jgi:phosphate transport system substrate-binding protein
MGMAQPKRGTSYKLITIFLLIGVGLGALVYFAPAMYQRWFVKEEPAPPRIKIGGTSVIHVLMENRWRTAYRDEKKTDVDYESSGSTRGIEGMIEKKYLIGCSHVPMTPEQKKHAEEKGGEVIQVPIVLCAVVPVYNVPELKGAKQPLNFDADLLAAIFLGEIDTWNHPEIQKLNPDVLLPATKITVVHRSDSSGTTLLFTDYLQASKVWRDAGMGPAKDKINWRAGEGKDRNVGVANHVHLTEGAIGYVDLVYGMNEDYQYRYGAVRNKANTKYIVVKADNITAAAEDALKDLSDDLTKFSLTNRDGDESYPISGAVWAVCYRKQPAAEHKQVTDFLNWITHEGQKFAENMAYAPLPQKLVERVDGEIKSIQAGQ